MKWRRRFIQAMPFSDKYCRTTHAAFVKSSTPDHPIKHVV